LPQEYYSSFSTLTKIKSPEILVSYYTMNTKTFAIQRYTNN